MSSFTQFIAKEGLEKTLSSYSSALTLTSNNAGYQILLNPSTDKSIVTLPNATTLSLGGNKFILENVTPYGIIVKSASGTILAGLESRGKVSLHLANNSTSGGVWSGNGTNLSSFILVSNTSPVAINSSLALGNRDALTICKLTDTTALVVYTDNNNVNTFYRYFARILTISGNTVTVGSATEIFNTLYTGASSNACRLVRLDENVAALTVYAHNSGNPQIKTYRITVSGSTITASTARTWTIGTSAGSAQLYYNTALDANTIAITFSNDQSGTITHQMQVQKWGGSSWTTANNITVSSVASQFGYTYVTNLSDTSLITVDEPNSTIRYVQMYKYTFTAANNNLASTGGYYIFSQSTASGEFGAVPFDANTSIACYRHPSTADLSFHMVSTSANSPSRLVNYSKTDLIADRIDLTSGNYNSALFYTGQNTAVIFYNDSVDTNNYKAGAIIRRGLDNIYYYTSNTTITNIPLINNSFLNPQNVAIMSNSATDFDKMLVVYSNNTSIPLVQLINYKFPQIMEK
jgi:hypothetical protein